MNGENGDGEKPDDADEDIELQTEPDDIAMSEVDEDVDNVGDISVEINVDELVAKIESDIDADSEHKREVRRRLDELNEEHDQDDEGTYNFDLDDDL